MLTRHRVRNFLISTSAVALLVSPAWPRERSRTLDSATSRTRPLQLAERDHTRPLADGIVALEVNRDAASRLARRNRATVQDFPLPGSRSVDLELTPFDVLTADARLVVVDALGEREVPRPDFRSYRGSVVGDPGSRVVLNVFEGRIAGSIRTGDDEYVFAPREYDLAREGSREVRVWSREADPDRPSDSQCASVPVPEHASGTMLSQLAAAGGGSPASAQGVDASTFLRAEVAIDATHDWYAHHGSLAAAQNYILNLMAQVTAIYESDVLVQIAVPYLRIFTDPSDPYTDGETSTYILLDELRTEWNANQTDIDRTVVHLFSVRPSGGSGVAYVDVLCSHAFTPGASVDYGVSTLSANGGSWEKGMVAHELGHNFSSPHTHCYAPEIDQCANQSGCYQGPILDTPSTIMSYCSDRAPTFHARVRDEQIRPAAEAAYGICIGAAGSPGRIDGSARMMLRKPAQCPTSALSSDDSGTNSFSGYGGTTQMTWVKRLSPTCYPFRVEQIDVLIGHSSSVAAGRPIRLLVYNDPTGSGDPSNATLVYSEDVAVQGVSNSVPNAYPLGSPVTVPSGDVYVGFYDLLADPSTTYIANVDTGTSGDSYRASNTTSAQSLSAYSNGTWMIRAHGGAVGPAAMSMEWGTPCNEATTPNQDFAIYRGSLGAWDQHASLTCSTGAATSYLDEDSPGDSYFLVVPRTSANEGSYGLTSAGAERPPASAACRPQSVGACP
jgi:hypothetical protein